MSYEPVPGLNPMLKPGILVCNLGFTNNQGYFGIARL